MTDSTAKVYVVRDAKVREGLLRYIGKLDLSPPMQVTVERYRKRRSHNQNSRYWAILDLVSRETGNDREHLHELMLQKFSPKVEVIMPDGEIVLMPQRSRKMNTVDFNHFMGQVEAFFADFGLILP